MGRVSYPTVKRLRFRGRSPDGNRVSTGVTFPRSEGNCCRLTAALMSRSCLLWQFAQSHWRSFKVSVRFIAPHTEQVFVDAKKRSDLSTEPPARVTLYETKLTNCA